MSCYCCTHCVYFQGCSADTFHHHKKAKLTHLEMELSTTERHGNYLCMSECNDQTHFNWSVLEVFSNIERNVGDRYLLFKTQFPSLRCVQFVYKHCMMMAALIYSVEKSQALCFFLLVVIAPKVKN